MIVNRPPRAPWEERPLPPEPQPESRNRWLLLYFVVLGFFYWLFARYLERLPLFGAEPSLMDALVGLLSSPGLMLQWLDRQWHVWRHFAPVIAGGWLAYEAAVSLMRVLYDLPDRPAARRLLARLRAAGSSSVQPLALQGSTLDADRERHVLLRVGGPGWVQVQSGDVAVTERNGRFYRILEPGRHLLDRFEYVHALLDLRPQTRRADDIPLTTQDGIPVHTTLSVTYRIATGGEPATRERPFPFEPGAVQTVAYANTVLAEGEVAGWEGAALGKARGILTGIVAGYPLDELLAPIGSAEPLLVIREDLRRQTQDGIRSMGLELVDLHVGPIKLPDPVTDQFIDYWQSQSDAHIRLSKADGEATALEEIEMARAEAEVAMIQAILAGVQRARDTGGGSSMRDVVALRLVEALEKMARQSQQSAALPAASLMTQLGLLRSQLQTGLPSGRRTPDQESP